MEISYFPRKSHQNLKKSVTKIKPKAIPILGTTLNQSSTITIKFSHNGISEFVCLYVSVIYISFAIHVLPIQ